MLDLWNNMCEYAIFDDFEDWDRFYVYKQFLGAQKEFVLTDKYRKKQNVQWGKPSIILSNIMPTFKDMTWIYDNCFICDIKENKLY